MATGTLTPWPRYTVLNAAGKPISGALLNTYTAGTTTPVATYSDVGLTTPNANPIVANLSGQIGPVFLTPGLSYKFVFTNPDGSALYSQDNISSVPGSSAGVDVIGTAGEALAAGQAVYLSDGSAGKTAGLWYKADNANGYSSITPTVGVVPFAISSASSGAIRLQGSVTGLSSLTVGAIYYVGTAGAMTTTAPSTNRRAVGQADTTSTLVVSGDCPLPNLFTSPTIVSPTINTSVVSDKLWVGTCNGRLTLTTLTPVTTADVTGGSAVTIFFTPYGGSNIALYDGSTSWTLLSFSEISIAVPATTATMYDVFVFNNSGTAALELLAWTNDTTRATALTLQNGVLVKSGATTRRYLGSFRTTAVSGQTEDSVTKRHVWNYYNRVRRSLLRLETTATWNYTTATWRQANGAAANQVDVVIGVAEAVIDLTVTAVNQAAAGSSTNIGIGEDVTNAVSAFTTGGGARNNDDTQALYQTLTAHFTKYPAVGRHFYAWIEASQAVGTTTWNGTPAVASGMSGTANGLVGWIEG